MTTAPLPTDPPPVFTCHLLVRRPNGTDARWSGRCANLAGVEAAALTERELLMALHNRFKFALHEARLQGTPAPWITPPLAPEPGEIERFIPMHL